MLEGRQVTFGQSDGADESWQVTIGQSNGADGIWQVTVGQSNGVDGSWQVTKIFQRNKYFYRPFSDCYLPGLSPCGSISS